MNNCPTPKSVSAVFFQMRYVSVALILGALFALGCDNAPPKSRGFPAQNSPLPVGSEMPTLTAKGWVNRSPADVEPADGQVQVVVVWSTGCGECRKRIPEVKEAYEAFAPQGVRFVGLSEDPEVVTDFEDTIKKLEIPWLNGYGTFETVQKLNVYTTFALLVVGRDGRVAWNNGSSDSGKLTDAIQLALVQK